MRLTDDYYDYRRTPEYLDLNSRILNFKKDEDALESHFSADWECSRVSQLSDLADVRITKRYLQTRNEVIHRPSTVRRYLFSDNKWLPFKDVSVCPIKQYYDNTIGWTDRFRPDNVIWQYLRQRGEKLEFKHPFAEIRYCIMSPVKDRMWVGRNHNGRYHWTFNRPYYYLSYDKLLTNVGKLMSRGVDLWVYPVLLLPYWQMQANIDTMNVASRAAVKNLFTEDSVFGLFKLPSRAYSIFRIKDDRLLNYDPADSFRRNRLCGNISKLELAEWRMSRPNPYLFNNNYDVVKDYFMADLHYWYGLVQPETLYLQCYKTIFGKPHQLVLQDNGKVTSSYQPYERERKLYDLSALSQITLNNLKMGIDETDYF